MARCPLTCEQQLPSNLQAGHHASRGGLDALEAMGLVKDASGKGDAAEQALLLHRPAEEVGISRDGMGVYVKVHFHCPHMYGLNGKKYGLFIIKGVSQPRDTAMQAKTGSAPAKWARHMQEATRSIHSTSSVANATSTRHGPTYIYAVGPAFEPFSLLPAAAILAP